MDADNDYVLVGRVSGLHGVRGWVKVYSHTQPRENILTYGTWYLQREGQWHAVKLQDGRTQGKGVVAKFQGIDDRDAATLLMETPIAIHRSQLPKAEPGEYYWADLEGLTVINREGVNLGVVSHLLETGANDVLVVNEGRRERLIPFVQGQFVLAVDLSEGVITVDWDPEF